MENSNRRDELLKLKCYTEDIDNELTLILQTLQWDRNHLLQNQLMSICRYDSNHKVPPDRAAEHEKACFLRKNGYSKDDQLLPDPLDTESNTLVKLGKDCIQQIIADASKSDTSFERGVGCHGAEPMSLERLQISYSADERRAIHDAVVSAVPSCHDLTDLMLPTTGEDKNEKAILSRKEILLELRNMRRRRTKYRVAAKSRNYSDVLRDVIKTQMEHFNDGKTTTTTEADEEYHQRDTEPDRKNSRQISQEGDRNIQDRYKKFLPRPLKVEVKIEGGSSERIRDYSRDRSDGANRYEAENRDRSARDIDRRRNEDRSRGRRNDDHVGRDRIFGDYSRKRRFNHDSSDEKRYRGSYYEGSNEKDEDYRSDKRSIRRYDSEDLDYQAEQDGNLNKSEKPRERRSNQKRDISHKHKEINRHDRKRRIRERSRERRSDHRYAERSSELIMHTKEEREYSITRDDKSSYERDRSRKKYDRKYDKAYKDGKYDRHSTEMDDETFPRYYDIPSQEIYNPDKVIKQEK